MHGFADIVIAEDTLHRRLVLKDCAHTEVVHCILQFLEGCISVLNPFLKFVDTC